MAYEFKLPDLGEGIHEGEILKWYVAVGDTVGEDAPLLDVETDKAAVTIPSPRGGKVLALGGKVGDIAHTGSVIAVIEDGKSVPAPAPAPTAAAKPAAPAPTVAAAPAPAPAPVAIPAVATAAAPAPAAALMAAPAAFRATGPVPAAPATRKLARELGLDINIVPGSGPGGRVTNEDVKAFAAGGAKAAAASAPSAGTTAATPTTEAPALSHAEREALIEAAKAKLTGAGGPAIPFYKLEPLPDFSQFGPVEITPLRSIRRKIAVNMITSMTIIPHVGHQDEADVLALDELRKAQRDRLTGKPGGKLTLMPFIVKAVVTALKRYPMFNASLDPFTEEVVYKKYYNIGIAIDSPKGLVVPFIRNVDTKSILEISADIEAIIAKAQDDKLEAADFKGGTFTITNVGPYGGNGIVPVVNYPECAILGLGRAKDKPVVKNGEIAIGRPLPLNLGYDHRIADGAAAARFITEVVQLLEDPTKLLLGA